ncbi:TIGR01457 family HAD-type hydrolase [Lentibacillus cibarius]|uniref:TIGR01457 family HAD-type hydrolase n=1 Tax=Lentibacillus cibarius TaxID=2583219 RepID=A0A5S3QH98_9BACI|nr:TIGR01457 family HAD-type hydrolase [Lentibacillus cibarius]TMN21260.1 TIGR01457 family HAD-type hydrolase [Lentibacillus cibarius]
MNEYKGYMIDLDGTMYKGDEPIPYAVEFVDKLTANGLPYLFLTNNSSKTQVQVSAKLQKMGIHSTPEQVFTTSMAAAKYINQQQSKARCYVIGEEGLVDALEKEGHQITKTNCDFVVIGMDRKLTYEKLAEACLQVWNGAAFISTNADVAIPTERGLEPGNGALTSVISVSTGKRPIFIGKPEPIIMNQALDALGTAKEATLMVGDNYDTDILAGINAGIDTLMVCTGVTPYEDYATFKQKPTYYVQTLKEWMK